MRVSKLILKQTTKLLGDISFLLTSKEPSEDEIRCLDTSLILYAEHGFNASTFTAELVHQLYQTHSCITGAIGTLRGPLMEEQMKRMK